MSINKSWLLLVLVAAAIFMVEISGASNNDELVADRLTPHAATLTTRQVNVPFSTDAKNPPLGSRAIFWFGQVNSTTNYADGRIAYNGEALHLHLNIFDRWLYYASTPDADDLENWDAATLFLDLNGSIANLPEQSSYKFVAQLNGNNQNRTNHQAAYRGSGGGWLSAGIPFSTLTGWRGNGLNNGAEARGWSVNFTIPFSSLGLTGIPSSGTEWSLAVQLHDRDDQIGSPIAHQLWPMTASDSSPATWGLLRFGYPSHSHDPAFSWSTATIRNEPGTSAVQDAQVGGDTNCGTPYNPFFFDGWGDANFAGTDQVNIQNQGDVADWPCFSKFYLTFPLNSVPPGKVIVSAKIRLHLFGNSEPTLARASDVQALTVAEDWNKEDITWNNAPLAMENISTTRVEPLLEFPGWPGVPYEWDVSRAAEAAYISSQPLRLVLYSADNPMHSGKYFSSSETGIWNLEARPTLEVVFGNTSENVYSGYIPLFLAED